MPRARKSLAAHLAPYRKPRPRAKRQERAWVVEGLLRRGEVTLLMGRPKDGKSCLAATLATAVARGAEFAGLETARTNALYLAAEESPAEWALGVGPYLTQVCPKRLAIAHAALALDDSMNLAALAHKIETFGAGLLVVDPLLAALDFNDLTTFAAARNVLWDLRRLARRSNAALLVVHHARERRDLAVHPTRDSGLASAADRIFVLNHRPQGDGRLVTLLQPDAPPLKLFSLNPGHYEPWTAARPNGPERSTLVLPKSPPNA